jgi:hypothetical protein
MVKELVGGESDARPAIPSVRLKDMNSFSNCKRCNQPPFFLKRLVSYCFTDYILVMTHISFCFGLHVTMPVTSLTWISCQDCVSYHRLFLHSH